MYVTSPLDAKIQRLSLEQKASSLATASKIQSKYISITEMLNYISFETVIQFIYIDLV